jgi:hypothetical protein
MDSAPYPVEQLGAVARLQRRDGGGCRLLRDSKLRGRACDMPAICDGDENPQLLERHWASAATIQSIKQIDIITIIRWIDTSRSWKIILNIEGLPNGLFLGSPKIQ